MRKIDLRINPAIQRLADSYYLKRAEEIDRKYSHIRIHEFKFHMMLEGDKSAFMRLYAQWATEKVESRFETYRDAFKQEEVIPDDTDLSNMSWAFDEIISNLHPSVPAEAKTRLEQIGRQIIKSARQDIRILAQEMRLEQMGSNSHKKTEPANAVHYTTNIHGPNYGGIQQGGQNNTQNVTINAEFEAKVNELLTLVENSSLSPVQKLKAVNDIKAIRELSMLEASPEVVGEAEARLTSVTSVISLSADLVAVGMPIIQIIRAFFGI